jgi:glucose dehydrogenase
VEVRDDRRDQQRLLTTGANLLFSGSREGYFQALDATTGDLLWKQSLGGMIANGPMSYYGRR